MTDHEIARTLALLVLIIRDDVASIIIGARFDCIFDRIEPTGLNCQGLFGEPTVHRVDAVIGDKDDGHIVAVVHLHIDDSDGSLIDNNSGGVNNNNLYSGRGVDNKLEIGPNNLEPLPNLEPINNIRCIYRRRIFVQDVRGREIGRRPQYLVLDLEGVVLAGDCDVVEVEGVHCGVVYVAHIEGVDWPIHLDEVYFVHQLVVDEDGPVAVVHNRPQIRNIPDKRALAIKNTQKVNPSNRRILHKNIVMVADKNTHNIPRKQLLGIGDIEARKQVHPPVELLLDLHAPDPVDEQVDCRLHFLQGQQGVVEGLEVEDEEVESCARSARVGQDHSVPYLGVVLAELAQDVGVGGQLVGPWADMAKINDSDIASFP